MPNALPKSMLNHIKNETIGNKELAEMFAPIVYFADDEKWLPTDMESFYSMAELRDTGTQRETALQSKQFRLEKIGGSSETVYKSIVQRKARFSQLKTNEEKAFVMRFLKHGHDYCLNLSGFDIEAMTVDPSTGYGGHGGGAVRQGAIDLLGNNKPGYKGCCYAKVRRLGRAIRFGSKDRKRDLYNGYWVIIHYFFFYSFNQSTNVHEGDWDSSITVCINADNGNVFVAYCQHHTTWFTRLNMNASLTKEKWLKHWSDRYDVKENVWNDREPGLSFGMGTNLTHPVGVVAGGSHGVYPTPGVIIFGIAIPTKKDLPFTVDDRKLGLGVGPKELTDVSPGFPKPKFKWENMVVVEDELDDDVPKSPFAFKGHWGEVSPTRSGWDGPKSPMFSDIWSKCDRTGHFEKFLSNDFGGYKSRYSRGGVFMSNVMFNTHAL